VNGTEWYWPADEDPGREPPPDRVRLLAPFDPLVWDRRRFELFWEWPYRFEAYTPVKKRKLGYYALPLAWRDRVIGWANASMKDGALDVQFGPRPRIPAGARPGSVLAPRHAQILKSLNPGVGVLAAATWIDPRQGEKIGHHEAAGHTTRQRRLPARRFGQIRILVERQQTKNHFADDARPDAELAGCPRRARPP
jgi:hypothetical protein